MMNPMRGLLLLALAFMFHGCAFRRNLSFTAQRLSGLAPMKDCWPEGKHLKVCHWKPYGLEEDPNSVLFFFHYATGDESSFARVGLANSFYRRYKKRGVKPPRVFTLSYGSHWLVSGEVGQRQTVMRKEFEEVLRKIEEDPNRKRFLWGLSMGGYNAIVTALSDPKTWAGAAASCPALHAKNPFTIPLNSQPTKSLRDGLHLFTYRLGGARVWDRENPNYLAALPGNSPPIYLEANAQDEFGFAPGARELSRLMRESGKPVVYKELPGGHCLVDGANAADFFIGLAAPTPKQ
jgi:pimeloyl-ACP methyl ester carboxylesterase